MLSYLRRIPSLTTAQVALVARSFASAGPARSLSGFSGNQPRIFTGYRIRKNDGLITMKVKAPRFRPVGKTGILHSLSSEGHVRVSLAPALPAGQADTTNDSFGESAQYSFDQEISINLNALDIVPLVTGGLGQPLCISKSVKNPKTNVVSNMRFEFIPPNPAQQTDGRAPTFTATLEKDGNIVSVSLSQAEFFLIRNLLGVSVPWVTGWQHHLDATVYDAPTNSASEAAAYESASEDATVDNAQYAKSQDHYGRQNYNSSSNTPYQQPYSPQYNQGTGNFAKGNSNYRSYKYAPNGDQGYTKKYGNYDRQGGQTYNREGNMQNSYASKYNQDKYSPRN